VKTLLSGRSVASLVRVKMESLDVLGSKWAMKNATLAAAHTWLTA